MKKAVFLDRDGTVTVGVPTYGRVDSPDKVRLLPNSLEAMRVLASLDYMLFFVTNQQGIAEHLITEAEFQKINDKVLRLIAPSGAVIEETYVCPHSKLDQCECQKPKPTLILRAAKEYDIDLAESYTIGDRDTDVQAGKSAGTKTILVRTGIPGMATAGATYTAADLLDAADYIANHL